MILVIGTTDFDKNSLMEALKLRDLNNLNNNNNLRSNNGRDNIVKFRQFY